MKSFNQHNEKIDLPNQWSNCPNLGELIANKFIPFKAPLDDKFTDKLNKIDLFTPEMLIQTLNNSNIEVGLIVDLTFTNRYYKEDAIREHGISHAKISISGHSNPPALEAVDTFIELCDSFFFYNPNLVIGVHCTHGFNRTGFLICSYLVTRLNYNIKDALELFSASRPTGIYKSDYIKELFIRYGKEEDAYEVISPFWHTIKAKKREKKINLTNNNNNNESLAILDGIELETDRFVIRELDEKIVRSMTDNKRNSIRFDFDSLSIYNQTELNQSNLKLIDSQFKVIYKPTNSIRCLIFVTDEQTIHLMDKDNVYKVKEDHLPIFPRMSRSKTTSIDNKRLKNALIDGEMVITSNGEDGKRKGKFIAYDLLLGYSKNYMNYSNRSREEFLRDEIFKPRQYLRERNELGNEEAFDIIYKKFYNLKDIGILLDGLEKTENNEDENKSIGLLFKSTRIKEMTYLEWKLPVEAKTVIFKIQSFKLENESMINLLVDRINFIFTTIKSTKELEDSHDKIVECKWNFDLNNFEIVKIRDDLKYPDSFITAKSKCDIIFNELSKSSLLNSVQKLIEEKTRSRERSEIRSKTRSRTRSRTRTRSRSKSRSRERRTRKNSNSK